MGKKLEKNCLRPRIPAAEALNVFTENDYLERLSIIALSRFEWQNLPESMDQRYLEWCLFMLGQAAILKTKDYGFINTKATTAGEINIYGLPTEINCYSFGEFNEKRKVYTGLLKDSEGNIVNDDYGEAILVMNNYFRTGNLQTLQLFANRLTEATRSIDVNVQNQKYPLLILTDQNQLLSMKQVYRQMATNEPVIYGSKKALTLEDIKVLKTDSPYVADKLTEYKNKVWDEALIYLGIQVIDEKKERLVESEASQNNEVTNLNLQSALITRQQAAKELNERFGLNVSVKVRSDLNNVVKTQLSTVADWVDKDEDGQLDEGEIDG